MMRLENTISSSERPSVKFENVRKKILGLAKNAGCASLVVGACAFGNCAWQYGVNDESTRHQISDLEMTKEDGPILWKVTRTIRLRDPQGEIQAEARGLECKINNVATTTIVVNCNNANEQQEMKTKYEGKTYKFMLGCVSTGQ